MMDASTALYSTILSPEGKKPPLHLLSVYYSITYTNLFAICGCAGSAEPVYRAFLCKTAALKKKKETKGRGRGSQKTKAMLVLEEAYKSCCRLRGSVILCGFATRSNFHTFNPL